MVDFEHVCIVPAKACSQRVPDKNFRPFAGGRSLVDITVDRLLRSGVHPDRLFLSCEDPAKRAVAESLGVQFHLRDRRLCENDCPFDEWMQTTVAETGIAGDVIWAQVCNPFFNEHAACFRRWGIWRQWKDSLCVRHPIKRYLIDANGRPLGWNWGPWHTKSQLLPTLYDFTWCLSILKRETLNRIGYHIGADPLWFDAQSRAVDIDTPKDFELAAGLFELWQTNFVDRGRAA